MTVNVPPKFAIDRCLGKGVPRLLRDAGWDVIRIDEHFPKDAQDVPDPEWLDWASEHLDAALTKDDAIRRSAWFQDAIIPVFCLSRQDLPIDEMAARFEAHRLQIWKIASSHPGGQFWTIYNTGRMERRI